MQESPWRARGNSLPVRKMEARVVNTVRLCQIVLLLPVVLEAVGRVCTDLAGCSESQLRMLAEKAETFVDTVPAQHRAAFPQQQVAKLVKDVGIIRTDLQGMPERGNSIIGPPLLKQDQRQPGMNVGTARLQQKKLAINRFGIRQASALKVRRRLAQDRIDREAGRYLRHPGAAP